MLSCYLQAFSSAWETFFIPKLVKIKDEHEKTKDFLWLSRDTEHTCREWEGKMRDGKQEVIGKGT